MPTYISLIQYTQQGIQKIKESPARLDHARKGYEAAGGKIKDFFLVMGEYDLVIISEMPNDEAVARLTLTLGSSGNIRTRTMRAFNESEYRKIVQSLP
ncbi:MAG: GYD domain-containing protein [Acidobacteriota bacterium]|nr:GYD domain-containing protein [Acidobacteriota bacterium]